MMRHYLDTKKEYSDCILFYRLGDFYEMFFEDAHTVSKELELTLTGKSCGLAERAPMCGVPFHSAETYISRLVGRGYRVAICEQMEDPKEAKGMVAREVTRIVSPGTNLNMQSIEAGDNSYLCCLYSDALQIGMAVADITTGAFLVTECESKNTCADELLKFMPKEIICNEAFTINGVDREWLADRIGVMPYVLDTGDFDGSACEKRLLSHFDAKGTEELGISDFICGTVAAGALLGYLERMQKCEPRNIISLTPYQPGSFMILDSSTRRNLELTETLREKKKRGSLLWVLDKTKTAMGARRLKVFVEQPLISEEMIKKRLDIVEALVNDPVTREEIREYLTPVYDLDRLMSKISYNSANPRDLLAFSSSLSMLPAIKNALAGIGGNALSESARRLSDDIDTLEDMKTLIDDSIIEEPPLVIREGGFIKDGVNEEIDRYRSIRSDGKKWLSELESSERERTGIKSLKIKYSSVFGYAFEITNQFRDKVPEDYTRKQTLTNAERYITPRLKELEDEIMNAQDRLAALEYSLFCRIREKLASGIDRVQKTANAISFIDAYASLATVAEKNRYVRPQIRHDGAIKVKDGRHPVVEQMLQGSDMFISNDLVLDDKDHLVSVITGPNMAGKSTYMRQAALIVLMAQIGSFVPASSAQIGVVDRIFTRVGASDDLASGQSTFMVEMNEVAGILRNATRRSLLILDEIGRGTSTYDGLSIAWAVIEYISNKRILGAKTLFATHYHELTELEGKIGNVNNYCIAVKESGDDIVFLRKIIKGGADKSYGVQVAKLAGVPDIVIDRAKQILEELAESDITERVRGLEVRSQGANERTVVKPLDEVDRNQMSFFETVKDDDILKELSELNIDRMTPFDALNTLYKWQSAINNRYINSH
ncbi:MAG: DNA mismatch repair protein MutS [Lachnospiraceae bacterium]|nr:DNA mismatch repair protein MutS [Lachnospiraceae bacterium]